jgi:hypothetical protein
MVPSPLNFYDVFELSFYGFKMGAPASVESHFVVNASSEPSAVIASTA